MTIFFVPVIFFFREYADLFCFQGITTTLHARAGVLAAANPIYGRYNPRLTPAANIGLPPSLLSRFDLKFILLDTPNEERDLLLAEHITSVHQSRRAPSDPDANTNDQVPWSVFRAYIAACKRVEPKLDLNNAELVALLEQQYIDERQLAQQQFEQLTNAPTSRAGPNDLQHLDFVSPRWLLGVIRLALAHARLHMRDTVNEDDISEAIRLTQQSQKIDVGRRDERKSPQQWIFQELRQYFQRQERIAIKRRAEQKEQENVHQAEEVYMPIDDLVQRLQRRQISNEVVRATIEAMVNSNTLHYNADGSAVAPISI